MQQQQRQQGHTPTPGQRPYRSHLRPACLPCRRRKSRCQTESGGSSDACLMCRAHGTECVYPGDGEQQQQQFSLPKVTATGRQRNQHHQGTSSSPRRRRRSSVRDGAFAASSRTIPEGRVPLPSTNSPSVNRPRPAGTGSLPTPASVDTRGTMSHGLSTDRVSNHITHQSVDEPSGLEFGSADDHALNLHIVGPAVTKDNQVLSDYLTAIPGATLGTRMVVPVPASRSRTILFTKVQKRPVGIAVNRSPSAEKLELIEKLLEPYAADVIDVYFQKVNSCFPVLDEVSFRRQYRENKDRISPALLACLYAHTLAHWPWSPPLSQYRCPDSRFIWNLANDAVYSELHLAPSMSMIKAILLNIGGLPTTSLIGNGVLMSSAASLAHSLGLNHNPLPWDIPESEKYLRMKIWWTLLVHDKWTSLAHGTPPRLSKAQYDVPPPTLEYLCNHGSAGNSQSRHTSPASVFIALVSLTEVLEQHLQFIYQVDRDKNINPANLELDLNTWVESLDGNVRLIILRGSHLDIPGASNLRFSYLTTRLLLQRIQLEADKQVYGAHDERLLNRYLQARRTAEDILIMTQEFQPEQFGDFWLSTSAFSYPATVNFLLRCALETQSSPVEVVQSTSFRIARDLIDTLRAHQENQYWNIGDVCLAQHAEIVDKIISSVSHDSQGSHGSSSNTSGGNANAGASNGFDMQDFVLPDASIIDQFFPSLWDPLQMQNAW